MATTMTEIPIKDLPLTTAPAGKQLLVRDASAGLQRIDYDQIAKNLVESYGSSSLAGKNQSIKAAIDSLNSGLTQCNTNITTINSDFNNRIFIKDTQSGSTFDIIKSNGWMFVYNRGSNVINGVPDIYNYRYNYSENQVVVTKMTNISNITCTATISNNTINFTFNAAYVRAIILTY